MNGLVIAWNCLNLKKDAVVAEVLKMKKMLKSWECKFMCLLFSHLVY